MWAKVVADHQLIQYDNERWIGPVDFRQNAQSFDAVSTAIRPIPGLELQYAYLSQINRLLGNHANGPWDSDSHLFRASSNVIPYGITTAYGHFLDLDPVPQMSSATYGIRFDGKVPIAAVAGRTVHTLLEAEFARQKNYAKNSLDFALTYSLIRGRFSWNNTMIIAG